MRQTIHFLFKQEILITTKKLKRQNDFKSEISLGYIVSSSIIYIVNSIIIWTTHKTLSQTTKINIKESPCLPNKTKTLNETLLSIEKTANTFLIKIITERSGWLRI